MSNFTTILVLAALGAAGWYGFSQMQEKKVTPQERARRIAQENLQRNQAANAARPKTAAPVIGGNSPKLGQEPSSASGKGPTPRDKVKEASSSVAWMKKEQRRRQSGQ